MSGPAWTQGLRALAGRGAVRALATWALFAAVGLVLYAPALDGPPLSDDLVVLGSAKVRSAAELREILNPRGAPTAHTANYAPLHLLAHAGIDRLFGDDTTGHHVVNVLLHALNALLLIALFRRHGMATALAAFAGLVFLLHPANVEAVAWIFQLKTQLSFALAVGAMMALERRPAASTALFAAALLCKIQAVFALPVAAALLWARPGGPEVARGARGLGAWLVVFALVAVPEFAAFRHAGEFRTEDGPGLVERIPFILEITARYVLLALTSIGASSFHQPTPPASFWEAGPLLGALLLLVVAVRAVRVLVRRRVEAAWWIWAAGGFLPVSQIFPFQFPMADRYLYFILPGLLGGLLLWAEPWGRRALAWAGRRAPALRRAAAVAAAALLVAFAAHTTQRAAVWSSGEALLRDGAAHYPDGVQGHILRATDAALAGDADEVLDRLESAVAQGFTDFDGLRNEAVFAFVRDDPRMQALLRRMAAHWIERTRAMPSPTAAELQRLGRCHAFRGEHAEALAAYERALEVARPDQQQAIRMQILRTRGALARAQRRAKAPDDEPPTPAPSR